MQPHVLIDAAPVKPMAIRVMKSLLLFSIALLVGGCLNQPETSRIDIPNENVIEAANVSYVVLSETPDATLDEMASKYSGSNENWRNGWKQENSSIPLDGQLAIRLLEISC